MTRLREIKTTFTAGEISPDLLGRGDLKAYENGALRLRNVFIKPTGGVTRRSGLAFIDTARGAGRLISFEFNTDQTYLLVLTDLKIDIYAGGVNIAAIDSPWGAAHINDVVWTQSADTLLLTHPDTPPKTLTRGAGGVWALNDWVFFTDENIIYQPYFKFAASNAALTPSALSGAITLTASAPVFAAGHKNTYMKIGGRTVKITDFDSATVLSAVTIEDLDTLDPTIDWAEQAFSPVRGYPISAAFHQDRLVIGGTRDLPNRLWFSKSGDLFNFDLGEGLDDESIEFSILSDQVNAIRGIFSGRHLQVFTSGAEWMVTGDPLTPTAVQIRRQTRIGSNTARYIPPINVDGAMFYVARNAQEIHEFLYTDLEQAYQSSDLGLLSRHVVGRPIDQDYDQKNRLLFVVRDDGAFATLTIYRSEAVSAWTLHETDGIVLSVCVVGDDVYMLLSRNGVYTIEQFDSALYLDAALNGESTIGNAVWAGLNHLEGKTVSILADGAVHPNRIVTGGAVTLDSPANTVSIGLAYTHDIQPLPPNATGAAGGGRKIRLVQGIFRLFETAALCLDVGRGYFDVSLRDIGDDNTSDTTPPRISRDIPVRSLGWQADGTQPLWQIQQSAPLAFTLLAVNSEIKVND